MISFPVSILTFDNYLRACAPYYFIRSYLALNCKQVYEINLALPLVYTLQRVHQTKILDQTDYICQLIKQRPIYNFIFSLVVMIKVASLSVLAPA